MFKVCIIGSGMIAKSAHIPAYKQYSNDFSIVGIFDVNKEAAEDVAKEFGIENVYTDAEEMLKEQNPDLVSVCAPNMFHKTYTLLALNYGANVLCEKPLAFTYADAKEMFDLSFEKGKTLMACQSLRFLPERLAVYEQVRKGNVGEVYYAELSRIRRRGIPTWGKFHLKEFSGGGALVDIGVHGIDSAIWLMGNPKPQSVIACMSKVHANEHGTAKSSGALKDNVTVNTFDPELMDVESFSSGTVKFENGAVLSFKVAWAANLKDENNITISGKKCGIDMENRKIYSNAEDINDLSVVPNGFTDEPFYGHFCLVKNMAGVLKGIDEPFIKPEETLNVTAILEAAYKSNEIGAEVKIDV